MKIQTKGNSFRTAMTLLIGALCFSGGTAIAQQWTTSGNDIYNANTGNVGIATTTPTQKLHLALGNMLFANGNGGIDGNLYFGGVTPSGQVGMRLFGGLVNGVNATGYIDVLTNDPTLGLLFRVGTSVGLPERMRINAAGNVGIGTGSPSAQLHVTSAVTGNLAALFISNLAGSPFNNTDTVSLRLGRVGNHTAELLSSNVNTGSLSDGYLAIRTRTTDALFERMRITNTGNVGIGTSAPTALLHVAGNAVFNGTVTGTNIQAQYQDLAEWVPACEVLPAGTVVVLDAGRNNEVTASQRPYDTKVAGVVSSKPGLTLGEEGEDKLLVATTGRVRVRVDASRAPVNIGDLLVTSDREGFAMRSTPVDIGGIEIHRPGTLIGKALEPLESGQGEILVLLSLQ